MHENISWLNVVTFTILFTLGVWWFKHLLKPKTVFKDDSEERFKNVELD